MKVLVIGGNRFVGLRLTHLLAQQKDVDLTIVNRTGQAPHAPGATVYKTDRTNWQRSHVDREWDVIVDFAAFNEEHARGSLEYFQKVGRYIFISTVSVYDDGADLKEASFAAHQFDLMQKVRGDYQDGKRRAEACFARLATFPVECVRFPFILGPDDYSRRLEFHVERILGGRPLYAPNLNARVSMIHAEDACRFLEFSLTSTHQGPLNVAAPLPISIGELMARIESVVGRRAVYMNQSMPETASPYGYPHDHFVNVSACQALGFQAQPITQWLDHLIKGAAGLPPSTQLH